MKRKVAYHTPRHRFTPPAPIRTRVVLNGARGNESMIIPLVFLSRFCDRDQHLPLLTNDLKLCRRG